MEAMQQFLDQDRYARYLGVEIIECREGVAKAKLKLRENHLNSVNTVHGGATTAAGSLDEADVVVTDTALDPTAAGILGELRIVQVADTVAP